MSIAIAGSGDVARYLSEELCRAGLPVVILCRRTKPEFDIPGVTQKVVDFTSVPSLVAALGDDTVALVSTILDYTMAFADAHKNLVTACQQSPKCRRFIPSEYGGDVQDYPDQPGFYLANHEPIRQMLREQNILEWTLLCCGWLVDYIVPLKNRYLKDIGDAFPVNLAEKRMVIPGSGKELVTITAARDMTRAIVALLQAPAGSWEPFTYVSGEKTTWRQVAEQVRVKYPHIQFEVQYISLTQLITAVCEATTDEARFYAEYSIFSVSNAANFDTVKVEAQRGKYFKDINFRNVQELLDEADKNPEVVL
ncbi:hypothetical protein EYZ11_001004 [Aspergillus tanneri]|uniref:NAD(P)-binding domain-containing protein n=1 Tax=Aspergillus tanneri TaxID=1220188 RepID=A0A4S3JVR5_9EURO|nr:uncharacterized protein ATNIH1004_002631 [Aspergillus tanneri]KAA8649952.1 hypothetical protein ATNIH1004_002631 [Aspergillus tanneri]THC99544.1 hypothetical protein EYZ11_001004 [Aspergillus tanneri]